MFAGNHNDHCSTDKQLARGFEMKFHLHALAEITVGGRSHHIHHVYIFISSDGRPQKYHNSDTLQ